MSGRDIFVEMNDEDFEFEISIRQKVDLVAISDQVIANKLQPFLIDMSINGFSQKEDFDFQIQGVAFSSVKKHFKSGHEAQMDPKALTIKRGIRVMAKATTAYIKKRKIVPRLSIYNPKLPLEYAHSGAHFYAPQEHFQEILSLWKNFDIENKTNIFNTVHTIIEYRRKDIQNNILKSLTL
jgi:hypothetical protein